MIDATFANFETEVVETSKTMPVLVDLWAPWCGPCRTLGPVLEKLETDYAGRFKLVKVNTEDEQDLAAAFGVRSIPMVVLMKDGQPVDGFVGALPEGQIRQFLDKHVPAAAEQESAVEEDEDLDTLAANDPESALEKLQQSLATNPADDAARANYVKILLELGRTADALRAFEPLAGKLAIDARANALKHWLDAIDATAQAPDEATLQAQIAANKRDFAARFQRAQRHMVAQDWSGAMDELLEILMRDRSWNDEAARKTYIAILELIAQPTAKPAEGQAPATDPKVESYRRRLSMVVLS